MTNKERNKRFRKERTRQLRRRTRIQRDTAAEVTRLLREAEQQIKAALAGAPTEFEAWYLPQLQQTVRQALSEVGIQAAARLSERAGESWQAGLDLVGKPIAAGGIDIAALLPEVDTAQLMAMRNFMTDRMKDVGAKLADKINTELGLVAIGAQNQGAAVANIASLLEKGGRSRAITIIRTELGRTYSTASHLRKQQAAEYLPGLKKQWRRSGKVHSRFHHDAADGQIQAVDKPFKLFAKTGTVELMFPRDPTAPAAETINCGCESLPYMESWEMANPKKKPFSDLELQKSRSKRALHDVRPRQQAPGIARGTAYRAAAAGGRHAGMLRQVRKLSRKEIEKGIRSLEKQIGKHQTWLKNPQSKIPGFNDLDARQQAALIERIWPGDIDRQREKIDILRGVLEEKG